MRVHPVLALAALIVGLVVGAVGTAVWSQTQLASIEVIDGEGFAAPGGGALVVDDEGYDMSPAWQEGDSWTFSRPPDCVPELQGQPEPIQMRVGLVEFAETDEAPGGKQVVWIRCGAGGG